MSTVDDLLVAIIESPDDDEPRLVWADAVGGERGELVVLQCRLAREDLAAAEHGVLADRVRVLLEAYGRAWSGFVEEPAVTRCMFRRGFVEAVEANVTELPWARIFEIAPLATGLELRGLTQIIDHRGDSRGASFDPIELIAGMFEQPAFDRVRAIGFDGIARYETIGDDEWSNEWTSRADELLELIARTGRLAGIRGLAIRDPFTPRGMHELLSSNALASLERLVFEAVESDPSQVRELLQNLPCVRALDLGTGIPLVNVVDLIPRSVVELHVRVDGDEQAIAPIAARFERLAMHAKTDRSTKPLIHATTNTREPWFDYGIVALHR
jgi:uncharacterized protein (TIGR02996 family)